MTTKTETHEAELANELSNNAIALMCEVILGCSSIAIQIAAKALGLLEEERSAFQFRDLYPWRYVWNKRPLPWCGGL